MSQHAPTVAPREPAEFIGNIAAQVLAVDMDEWADVGDMAHDDASEYAVECPLEYDPDLHNWLFALAAVIHFDRPWESPSDDVSPLEHIVACEACIVEIACARKEMLQQWRDAWQRDAEIYPMMPTLRIPDTPEVIAVSPEVDAAGNKREDALYTMVTTRWVADLLEEDPLQQQLWKLRRAVYQYRATPEFQAFHTGDYVADLTDLAAMSCVHLKTPLIVPLYEALWSGMSLQNVAAEDTAAVTMLIEHMTQCASCLKAMNCAAMNFAILKGALTVLIPHLRDEVQSAARQCIDELSVLFTHPAILQAEAYRKRESSGN